MTVRTSVAFDPATAARLQRLAKRWGVSKSETLRRALESAEKQQITETNGAPDFAQMSPIQTLDWLSANPQVAPGWGENLRSELLSQRLQDAQIEEAREHTRKLAAAKRRKTS